MTAINDLNTASNEQEDLQDLTFEELLARSRSRDNDKFKMHIKVRSKTIKKVFDKHDQPYIEIAVDYVTVPKGKEKTKRTRPSFPDGQLIWEQISDEPGVNYLVTLTRQSDQNKPFYDWTEIVRRDEDNNESALINALSILEESDVDAANQPAFDGTVGEVDNPQPTIDTDTQS